MAAGNQAAGGGKPQGPGYELGDLDIQGQQPKRSQSGTQPAASGQPAASAPTPAPSAAQSLAKSYAAKAQEAARIAAQAPANQQGGPVTRPEKGVGRATSIDLGADAAAGGPALELDLAPARKGKDAAPAAPAFDFSAFGGKSLGDGFGEPEEGPAIELEQVERAQNLKPATNKDARTDAALEVQATKNLADFGDTPENLVACVTYAVHVAKRLLFLRGERAKVAQEVAGLEADHEQALVGMGQALMALAENPKLQALGTKMSAVKNAQAKVSQADQTMSKTRAANQQAVLALEAEAGKHKLEMAPFVEAEKAAEQVQKKADEELKRGQAHQKRVEIELRSLTDAKTPPDSPKLLEAKAQLDQRKSAVASLSSALETANGALGQARRDLALRRGALDAVEEKKKRLTDTARAKEAEVEQRAKAAEGSHAGALRALAEGARAEKLEHLVQAESSMVADVETVLADARKVLARHDRALVLYDRPSVYKGVGLVAGVIVLLIGLLTMR